MSKSERYWYDNDSVREPYADASMGRYQYSQQTVVPNKLTPKSDPRERDGKIYDMNPLGRNRRTVWRVNTEPFAEAHFATFPPKLVEPCILAGCPQEGTVLDPFNGAGTTGLVATRLGRNYIGIELNADYIAMAERRITQDAPLFNTVTS